MAIGYYYGASNIQGSGDDDFIFGTKASNVNAGNFLYGNGGDDLIIGDAPGFWFPNPNNVQNGTLSSALNIDFAPNWSTAENSLVGDTSIPYTSIYATMSANEGEFYSVSVGIGETITVDVDFAGSDALGVACTPVGRLTDANGANLDGGVFSNASSGSYITYGGLGSLADSRFASDFRGAYSDDPYLIYTNNTGAPQTVYIGLQNYVVSSSQLFSGGEAFVVNVSVTGHVATGQVAIAADSIAGGDGNDMLFGDGGGDLVDGEAGDDYIDGGSGDDAVYGGIGNDQLWGGRPLAGEVSTDLVHGNDGNDIVTASGRGSYYGDAGDDILNSSGAGDYYGGADSDSLHDAAGASGAHEMLDGGDGVDTVILRDAGLMIDLGTGATGIADVTMLNFENATGGSHNDAITGSTAGNVLIGNDGDDMLNGGGGNDTLGGGNGYDTIDGGDDDDTITDSTGIFDGGSGTDTLILERLSLSYAKIDVAQGKIFAGDDPAVIGQFTGFERYQGSVGSDLFISGAGGDWIDGGGGNDEIRDNGGNDTFGGGLGVDELKYLAASAGVRVNLGVTTAQDTIGAGIDTISGIEFLYGSDFGDTLTGSLNNTVSETLAGYDGNDVLVGGTGQNALYGLNGDDVLAGGGGADVLNGGAGVDTVTFAALTNGITLDMSAWTSTGYPGTLQLVSVEGVIGTAFDDFLTAGPAAGAELAIDHDRMRDSRTHAINVDGSFTLVPSATAGSTPHTNIVATSNATSEWYSFTVSSAGTIVLDTSNTAFNTVLTLYDASGNKLATNDDASMSTRYSHIAFSASAGTYYAVVEQYAPPVGGSPGPGGVQATPDYYTYNLTISVPGHAASAKLYGVTFDGGDGADTLAGKNGDDVLIGGAGADLLNGGTGADRMTGGADNDIYVVDDALDRAIEIAGGGYDRVASNVTFHLNANVEALTLTGTAAIDGYGNADANAIVGNDMANVLGGKDGDDTLTGAGGADVLDGGRGADTMTGGADNDVYYVDAAGDQVIEVSGGGADKVSASIDYTLPDQVETLILTGTARSGTGNALDNAITGTSGNDMLSGLDGADTLKGGAGNDTIIGGIGNDVIFGGAGRDTLTGGAGADRFAFLTGDSGPASALTDRITDFSHAEADRVALNQIDANSATPADNAFGFIGTSAFHNVAGELRYSFAGADTLIEGDTNGDGVADLAIRLTGHVTLVAGDFVL